MPHRALGLGSIAQATRNAATALVPVSLSPRLDAELLMAHALGLSREELLLHHLDDPAPDAFEPLLVRRLAHEPVAYITGRRAFWTIELEVGPGVLVPRPDSETLIEAAVAYFGDRSPARILDLGTGPGTLLLAALDHWPQATGLGVDASAEALAYARRNAVPRAQFRLGDWGDGLDGLGGLDGRFDLILCNPPYVAQGAALPPEIVRHEPAGALFAGPDGLDAYRVLAPQLASLLAPKGVICIEIGAGQLICATSLFVAAGFTIVSRRDLAGMERCLVLTIDGD